MEEEKKDLFSPAGQPQDSGLPDADSTLGASRPIPESGPPEQAGKAASTGGNLADCGEEVQLGEFEHPADLAEKLEHLPLQKQVCMLSNLSAGNAAETLAELDEHVRVDILENMDPDVAAGIVGEMYLDDAADVLDELDEDHRDVLLNSLESEDAEEIRNLMAFDPETAGGLMNTEIIILEHNLTADEAIARIRNEIEDKEIPYYVYVVNEAEILVGVLSLRDLMLSRPGTLLADTAKGRNLISVTFDKGREEIARLFGHYNFMALPVVDYEGRLMGIVTHDDVIDIMHDLASEDMLGMVGAGVDESVDTPWKDSVTMRLPWLIVNMVNSALSAAVVLLFEGSIAQMAVLAVLMPMVANQAGNTGQQSLAVMIRQLAVGGFERRKIIGVITRESKISLTNGLFLGLFVWGGVFAFTRNTRLATVMVMALIMDMLLGAVAGASIPLILKRLGRDPAQASSIFLTALTDGAGFFMFLGMATLFLL